MNLKKSFITKAIIGFTLGILAGTIITAVIASISCNDGSIHWCSIELEKAVGSKVLTVILQAIVTGIFGAVALGGSVLYSFDHWSLIRITITHYLMVMIGYYIVAFLLRWFTYKDWDVCVTMFITMTIAYLIIFMINYLVYKSQIKKINTEIE